MTSEHIQTNGIRLHVVSAGPATGPLVILLHGFPDFWYGWRRQIAALAAAGYRVLAPDQRGYNRSPRPSGLAAYRLEILAADVVGLIRAAGREHAVLVGHDWGGIVAWAAALLYPAQVARLVILNAPHPGVTQAYLRRHPVELLHSAHIFLFQVPGLPERLLGVRRAAPLALLLRITSRPGTFPAADLRRYRRAWTRPGALAAMIHWYRAVGRYPSALPAGGRVAAPTLGIWGAQDPFLSRGLAAASFARCDAARLEFIEGASHWVQHEEPERVNTLLQAFLA